MSMRHLRDPITGAKVGAEANQSADPVVRPRPSFRDAATKVVYVNTGFPPAPPPPPPPPAPEYVEQPPSLSSRSDTPASLSHVYYQSRTPSPRPGPGNVMYINHDSGTPRWPTTRGRSPSPRRSMAPEYNGRSQPKPFGHNSRFVNNKNGSAYHVGKTYQGAQWTQRRCYALLWGIFLMLLLAGLAAGIYFLVKYTEAQKALRAPDVLYPGGYYQNGLYILPSTIATPASYGIVGHDRPCNPYNNNTQESILNPNCNSLTTIIVNLTTTTTTPLLVTADAGSCPMLCITTLLVTTVASSCFGLASYFQL